MKETCENTKGFHLSSFDLFEKSHNGNEEDWVHAVRREAFSSFVELGFPTTRNEEWKYTSVAPIAKTPFTPFDRPRNDVTAASLAPYQCTGRSGIRLVFVNGRYSPELSSINSLPETVRVGSLADAIRGEREVVEPALARYASFKEQAFTALNTAFMKDGAFVYVPRGVVVKSPIHVLFVTSQSTGETPLLSPRTLVVVEEQSQVSLVESYVSLQDFVYFTNAVTEIIQGENSVVDLYKIQEESDQAYHIATTQIHQDRNSTFASQYISLGGSIIRNDVNAVLDSEGCNCTLNGLYVIHGRQHEDNHTRIDHVKPHCASHELYKGILSGRSTGVFNGKVYVHEDAQKTDAKQTNKNLILSEEAQINTKPQLEIYADDVKCTHGATVGQLDEDALFYLRSRGIGREHARNILTCAFARDIIDRIKIEPLRIQVELTLLERLENGLF